MNRLIHIYNELRVTEIRIEEFGKPTIIKKLTFFQILLRLLGGEKIAISISYICKKVIQNKNFKNIFIFNFTVHQEYRQDINLWEKKVKFLGLIPYYVYRIFRDGKEYNEKTFFMKNKETKKYFVFVPLSPIKVGRKEFEEKYKGNKYLLPLDFVLDLN